MANWSEVIPMFTVQLLSMQKIAIEIGVSRQAVHQYLRSKGIDTSKKKIKVPCEGPDCKKILLRNRCHIKKNRHNFCSHYCRLNFMRYPIYAKEQESLRAARQALAELNGTQLIPYWIDGNPENNGLENLLAFRSEEDRKRFLVGGRVDGLVGKSRNWQEVRKIE